MQVADSNSEYLKLQQATWRMDLLKQNLEKVIKGKPDVIRFVQIAILTGESILIEDVPGVGKTTIAKTLAASLELDFQRVQCTPDLMPSDIFGVSIFNPQDGGFQFRKGPIFCNLLLVDEINRASPRTQSALLEAMAEQQVTADGQTFQVPQPFFVIATQNPMGFRGTFPLPESQLDRFLMQITMDYPGRDSELEILYQESGERIKIEPVLYRDEILQLQTLLQSIGFDKSLANYLLEIVDLTRNDTRIQLGCSPRGAISLFKAAKARAMLEGRTFVLPDDIQNVARYVLQHRVVFESNVDRLGRMDVIDDIVEQVDVPV